MEPLTVGYCEFAPGASSRMRRCAPPVPAPLIWAFLCSAASSAFAFAVTGSGFAAAAMALTGGICYFAGSSRCEMDRDRLAMDVQLISDRCWELEKARDDADEYAHLLLADVDFCECERLTSVLGDDLRLRGKDGRNRKGGRP